MKRLKITILACALVLAACSSVESSKVGYQELSNSIQTGQRLQLVTKAKKVINIKVTKLNGDIIEGESMDSPGESIQVNINELSKIRVYE